MADFDSKTGKNAKVSTSPKNALKTKKLQTMQRKAK